MKSSKMVFDLRNWQKDAIAPAVADKLQIVKEGGGESAVFIVDEFIGLEEFGNFASVGFSLAHIENVAVPQVPPYQLIRFELQEKDLFA